MGTDKRARQKANRQLKYQEAARAQTRHRLTRRIVVGVIAVVVAVVGVIAIAALSGIGDDEADAPSGPECPPAERGDDFAPTTSFAVAPPLCIDPAATYTATIVTSKGDIVVDLDTVNTPNTVNNFVFLARSGYYDDTKIFRAASSIDIIQGGGVSNTDSPGYTIEDEGSGFTYEPGQLVMARTQQPNSAGAQWFIVTGDKASNLDADGSYVVFGTISQGLDVAQAIQALGLPDETLSEDVTVATIAISEGSLAPGTTTPGTGTEPAGATTSPATAPDTAGTAPDTAGTEPATTLSGG